LNPQSFFFFFLFLFLFLQSWLACGVRHAVTFARETTFVRTSRIISSTCVQWLSSPASGATTCWLGKEMFADYSQFFFVYYL
jgi:hypothetical protein